MQKVVVDITNNSCKCQIVATSRNLLVTKSQFFSSDMSQKGKTLRPKTTFVKVEFDINLFEFLKNQLDVT